MNTLTTVLAILVALEHLYIMFLETIATSSESTYPRCDLSGYRQLLPAVMEHRLYCCSGW